MRPIIGTKKHGGEKLKEILTNTYIMCLNSKKTMILFLGVRTFNNDKILILNAFILYIQPYGTQNSE